MISILNSIICPRLWRKRVLGTMLAKSIPWFESWLHPIQFVEDEKCRSKIFIQRSPHTLFWRTRWASSAIYRVRLFVMEIGYKCHIMLMFKLCIFFSAQTSHGTAGVAGSSTELPFYPRWLVWIPSSSLYPELKLLDSFIMSLVCVLSCTCVCVKCKQSCSVCL